MEERTFQKPSQRYRDRRVEHRKVFRNKKSNISTNQTQSNEQSKINWVKPTSSPRENGTKPTTNGSKQKESVVLTDQNRATSKGKSTQVKEQKTNYERRTHKENSRPFRVSYTGKYQNRARNTSSAQSKVFTEQRSALEGKQNDSKAPTSQYLKPAVHVQPIQQLPEQTSGDCRKTGKEQLRLNQSTFDLVPDDSSLHLQHLLHEGTKDDTRNTLTKESNRSLIDCNKDTVEQSKPPLKEPCDKSCTRNVPGNTGKVPPATIEFHQAASHNNIKEFREKCVTDPQVKLNAEYDNENNLSSPYHSSFDPTNKTIIQSSIRQDGCNPLVLTNNKERPGKDSINVDIKDNQSKRRLDVSLVQCDKVAVPSDPCQSTIVQPPYSDEKYGYRISVDSLFSTSFFANSQSNQNKQLEDDTVVSLENKKNDNVKANEVPGTQPCVIDIRQDQPVFSETPNFVTVDTVKPKTNGAFLSHNNLFTSSPLAVPNNEPVEEYDARLVSPRNRSSKRAESEHVRLPSPRKSDDLFDKSSSEVKYVPELVQKHIYTSQDQVETFKPLGQHVELAFPPRSVHNDLTLFPSVENPKTDVAQEKDVYHPIQQREPTSMKQTEKKIDSISGMQPLATTISYEKIPITCKELEVNVYGNGEKDMTSYPVTSTVKTSVYETEEEPPKQLLEEDPNVVSHSEDETQVHRETFSQGPYLPNPFFNHSLLTHRAIPSAFVYPSRVGLPGNHSGFTDVGQHSGTSLSPHLFPTPGNTVCLNVGGRLFEVLPSTFVNYPESLLYHIFTGTASAQVNQRGHIFFDRDGYLFEIILAFARLGQLTLPPRVSLTALINEAKFFGMYEYMFQQGQVPCGSPFHFQRTTCCTLAFDSSSKNITTKVFVLQGEDKLKIESLKATGSCHLYVDLYTPSGVKETSNFLLYGPEKPDLWKAYQFCAERQLVFHLGRTDNDDVEGNCNASVYIVFAQTFVFHGDEFIP